MTRTTTSFTYNSQPHSAPRQNQLFSQTAPGGEVIPLTMMSDPRVIRGNTYSLARKIAKERTTGGGDFSDGKQAANRPPTAGSETENRGNNNNQPSTLRPTMPFYSFSSKPFASDRIDLSAYLVDSSDEMIVPSAAVDSQTDEMIPLTEPAPYIPKKTGIDAMTQVDDVNELYDFDSEASPLVEVIVAKILEQSLTEVNNESELLALTQQTKDYEVQKQAELTWVAKHEGEIIEEQRRMHKQMEVLAQALKRRHANKQTIAGLQMMKQIYPEMIEGISEQMTKAKKWIAIEKRFISERILPELINQTLQAEKQAFIARELVDDLLLAAQSKFDSLERPVRKVSEKKFILRFLRPSATSGSLQADADNDEQLSRVQLATVPAATEVMTLVIPVSLREDSVLSLERKVSQLIRSLKKANNGKTDAATEGDEAAAAAAATETVPAGPEQELPDSVSLYSFIAQRVINDHYLPRGLPAIQIARDATLNNFEIRGDLMMEVYLTKE